MEFVTSIPVECLSAGEAAAVWSGWSTFGDREVVREASAKGTHIDLAYKCLAYRRHCTLLDAQKYFSEEVEIWVNEMLNKQQIHRATHILKNAGKNPVEFIKDKCIECKEPKLRKYLANYVVAKNGFEGKMEESWNIMNSITLFEEENRPEESLIKGASILEISQLPEDVKSALITDLYFYTNQSYLGNKLTNTVLWDYLLSHNKIQLIEAWIDAKYSNSEMIEHGKIDAFSRLEIVEDMIESVETSSATNPVKELVLNRLSNYGIFTKKERQDVKLLLSRMFSNCKTPNEFMGIFSRENCNVDRELFEKELFSILYNRNASESSLQENVEPREKKLLELLLEISEESAENELILQRAILENIAMLSSDFEGCLRDNPLIVVSLVYLEYRIRKRDNEFELKEIFKTGMKIDSRIVSAELICEILGHFPYLIRSLAEDVKPNDVTIYQLLNGYENLDVQRLFKWRYRKEPMPSFTSENLIKKYGRKEKLTYVYYLKESRPTMAAYVLQKQQDKKRDGLSSKMKCQAASYAHAFGLENLEDDEIMCSCIVFIEMLDVNSECLRLHATAADYVKKRLNLSIDDLLQRVSPKNPKDLDTILKHLEMSFQTSVTEKTSREPGNFVEAMKSWDFIVRFARAHNASLPCSFLKFLARNNLWFEFVLVAHVFSYPLELALESARHFSNSSIRKHLSLALSNPHILTGNFAQNHLPKVKLGNLTETRQSSVDQQNYNSDNSDQENDLWLIILNCHQSQDPPGALLSASQMFKSPVLTVLAACYEPSSISAYCYSWLVVSVDDEQLTQDYASCLGDQLWPAQKVSQLFRSVLSLGYVTTLSRAFHIFMPENPLCKFFDFIVESVDLVEFKGAREKLRDFINGCVGLKSNKSIDWESVETDYLNNSYWIVTVAIESAMTVLGKCLLSTHLQIKFLEILVDCNFNEDLHVETPNFSTLWETIKILTGTKTVFGFDSIRVTPDEGSNVNAELRRCIHELVELEDFLSALQLSKVAGFNCSTIILAQYRSEFKRSTNAGEEIESSFWKRCAEDLKRYGVTFEETAAFFVEHAEKVSFHKERYEILKLALETLEPIVTDKQTLDTVEMAMWKSCILAGPDSIEIETESEVFNKLKSELLSGAAELRVSCSLNDSSEESAVELLINRFISAGQLATALRINTIFNYKHKDLQILLLCLSLAEGEISPYQLTSQQRSLLSDSGRVKIQKYATLKKRGFQIRSSVSPMPASSGNTTDGAETSSVMIQQIQLESLSMIDKLVKSLQNGFAIGTRILLCTKLGTYLRRSYQSLLTLENPMQLLYEVVGSNCDRKLEMVGDIIVAYRIKNEMVAKFLAEEIVANTPRLVEESLEDSLVMWGNPLGGSIQAIIELCNDPSLLGWELLKTANLSLGNSHGERRNVLTLKVAVELLIHAHDCFTASCSMEGIASILRKAQHLVYTLQQRKHWSLLVRLVTGLGRFTEMNYIFQILKENDQFEFLLGKGLDKIPGLKTALLEFCKRQCPGDKELFTLIALHFLLYNEIAFKWESEAKEIINELVAEGRKNQVKASGAMLKLTKNENIEKKLQVVIENYTHATEYYLQDNKLNLASRCSYQAQLAALQISLLAGVAQNHQVTCLFSLSPDEVNKAMCQELTVPQSLILVQAYNHHGDWSIALYNHVVINGETRYFKEFLACNLLSSAIVHDCVCRYRSEKTITKQMTESMQLLVSELTDVECKYVLASQLGFKKIIEDLLANPSTGSYLKDTVWKQGSKAKDFMADNYRG
ncbi:spatacsin [Venturia canescens]|uniref:spatacsin n=1 Tax=Venturia canescens TaxID=32260 RepID=UPI001C9BEA41|nr:spatacsin [Venturia canescens]XP_043283378.1 spatacsin [Venturia canescens]XP_043283379.1 spatacsin [Venturia canescens]